MKKQVLTYLIFLIGISGYCQQLYMEYGTTISAFDYENSQGQPLDNLLSKSKSYFGMGYRHVLNNRKTVFLAAGLSYNNYGAIGSESSVDNFFEWDVSYLGVKAGLDIRLFQLQDLSFFASVSVASEFLIRGNQTINTDVFNLVGEEDHTGNVVYENMETILKMNGVTPHIYGKKITKPFRKMGHVTIVHQDLNEARKIAEKVKKTIRVVS